MWDSKNDARIIFAKRSINLLEGIIQNAKFVGSWDKKGALKRIKKIRSLIEALKYSFGDIKEVCKGEEAISIQKETVKLLDDLGGEGWDERFIEEARKEEREKTEEHTQKVRFFLNLFYNLSYRLCLGERVSPAVAVDIRKGKILSCSPHPFDRTLTVCRVDLGKHITVVTNVKSVKREKNVAIALLPPKRIKDILSEGMFLGSSDGLWYNPPGEIGEFIFPVPEEYLKETEKEVSNFLKSSRV